MESGRIQITKPTLNKPASFLKTFNGWVSALSRHRTTHDYSHLTPGVNYVFEPMKQGEVGQMTGYGKRIQAGDSLLLCLDGEIAEYQVEDISYYADPPGMWIGMLTKMRSGKNPY